MARVKASPSPRTKLYLLGTFRLERDGKTIALPRRKVEALLAYLALFPEPHLREKIAALFWGDATDADARLSLRVALTNLRSLVGDSLLLADRETVQLNPDFALWVDAVEFRRGSPTEQPPFEGADDSANAAHALPLTLLDLYTGDLLPNLYDDWVLAARQALRELYLERLLGMAQQARAAGEYEEVVAFARRALETDPTLETAHQHLIFAYAMRGDRPAALRQFAECKAILARELGVEPSPETAQLIQRLRTTAPARPSPYAQPTNLPLPVTSFVGREQVLSALQETLGTTRMLTLTGPGGCGKTRLAIELARRTPGEYSDGVWWIDLAPLTDPSGVAEALMRTLGVQASPRSSATDSLVNHLGSKQVLLVLDNCEHLLEPAARLAQQMLVHCPHLRIVATSREALNIPGEIGWLVPPLSAPRPEPELMHPAPLLGYESVRLFVDRAQAVRHDFALTTANTAAVAEICSQLDGIPLALELAAARVRGMGVRDIAAHLDDRFRLLAGGSRAALPRQQTLRALIDWSYNLLTEEERLTLQRAAVLVGGWTLETAQGVYDAAELWDLLPRLVDKSLLMLDETGERAHYRMLETIRQYALERLCEAGEEPASYDKHLAFFLRQAQDAHPEFFAAGQSNALQALRAMSENLRGALDWALVRGTGDPARVERGIQLALALYPYWILGGEFVEAIRWLQMAAEHAQGRYPQLHAHAFFCIGVCYVNFVDRPSAYPFLRTSASEFRALGDEANAVRADLYLAFGEFEAGRGETADAMWEVCLAELRARGDDWHVARTLGWQARAARYGGDYARARDLYASSVALFRGVGDDYMRAYHLNMLGTAEYLAGDYEDARASLETSVTLSARNEMLKPLGSAYFRLGLVAWSTHDTANAEWYWKESLRFLLRISAMHDSGEDLASLALVAEAKSEWSTAAQLWATASQLGIESRYHDRVREPDAYNASIARVRAALGADAFEEAWRTGQALPTEQAIQMALAL